MLDSASAHRRLPPLSTTGRTLLLRLLAVLHLLALSQARLSLNASDLTALIKLQRGLGIETNSSAVPCDFPGVNCETRLSSHEDAVLEVRVTGLVFESRRLRGSLSSAVGRLSELKELSLPSNDVVGRIPSRIADCKNLEILNLRNNFLSGEVPDGLSSLLRLRVLDLSNNELSGDLSFLGHFPSLEILDLAHNHFTGTIPGSLHSFKNLRVVDFSGNVFLEGHDLPKRNVLLENSSRGGNQAPSPSGPATSRRRKTSEGKKVGDWVIGLLAGAIAGGLAGLVFSMMLKLIMAAIRGGKKEPGPVIFSKLIQKAEDLAFLEKEDGIAALEVIGKGGCGEVYKAELPGSNGKMIAIKKIIHPPKNAADLTEEDSKFLNKKMWQLRSEIKTVGEVRHRNLLPLLAHFPRPKCHYLVYEYMKNGSLQDVLTRVPTGATELDWSSRLRIAMGVAAGLEYLHMSHNPRIIHRDLKPANILLDDDMEPRIADFGLAKAIPSAETHISTSNVAGTVGYIAPEYHQTLKFTAKCDVYSFGVLLGVLVVGKLPSDDFFQHTMDVGLIKWLRNVMTSENPSQAIDQKLIGNGFEEQMLLVLKIACFCTLDDPKQRPCSNDVRCMLSQIKH